MYYIPKVNIRKLAHCLCGVPYNYSFMTPSLHILMGILADIMIRSIKSFIDGQVVQKFPAIFFAKISHNISRSCLMTSRFFII